MREKADMLLSNGRGPLTPLQLRAAFRAQLILKNTTARGMARRMGVSHQHLAFVLRGHRVAGDRLQAAIADFLEVRVDQIFPPKVPKPARQRAAHLMP